MRTIMIIVQESVGAPPGGRARPRARPGSGPGGPRGPAGPHGGDAHAAAGVRGRVAVVVADGVDGVARVAPWKTCRFAGGVGC